MARNIAFTSTPNLQGLQVDLTGFSELDQFQNSTYIGALSQYAGVLSNGIFSLTLNGVVIFLANGIDYSQIDGDNPTDMNEYISKLANFF